MADLGSSSFNEIDNSNSEPSPAGAPEGMSPGGLNDTVRAVMGAVKRFWNRSNAVKTTGGTSSAYTLTYGQAASAYYDGEIISFVANAANAASATINVNALGAKPLRLFGGNLLAGALVADQIVQARYNSAAGVFDIIPQHGIVRLASVSFSAASNADFPGIPAGVNNIHLDFECTVSSDGAEIDLQTYGADGNLDIGAADYGWWGRTQNSDATGTDFADSSDSNILVAAEVDNSTAGCSVTISAANIQAATRTKFNIMSNSLSSTALVASGRTIFGQRLEADRITGVRLFPSAGTITGRATLYASA